MPEAGVPPAEEGLGAGLVPLRQGPRPVDRSADREVLVDLADGPRAGQ